MSNSGKTIWDRNHIIKGIIAKESTRYCKVCGVHSCYIVKWENGFKTKPCTSGVKILRNNDLQIM